MSFAPPESAAPTVPPELQPSLALCNYTASFAPSTSDDEFEGYQENSIWYMPSTQQMWVCVNPADDAAVWIELQTGAGLAIGTPITGGTAQQPLYVGAGGLLAQLPLGASQSLRMNAAGTALEAFTPGLAVGSPISGAGANEVLYTNASNQLDSDPGLTFTLGVLKMLGGITSQLSPFLSERFGFGSVVSGDSAVAAGRWASASLRGTAIGDSATANATDGATAIGANAHANTGYYPTAIGFASNASNHNTFALGVLAVASGDSSIAIGYGAQATIYNAFALGRSSNVSGDQGIAIGNSAGVAGNTAIAIGSQASAAGYRALAIGELANAAHHQAIAIGRWAASTMDYQIVLGSEVGEVRELRIVRAGSTYFTIGMPGAAGEVLFDIAGSAPEFKFQKATRFATKVGFYGTAPVAQPIAPHILTAMAGSAGFTLYSTDVGGVADPSVIDNNFASVTEELNKITTALVNLGLVA